MSNCVTIATRLYLFLFADRGICPRSDTNICLSSAVIGNAFNIYFRPTIHAFMPIIDILTPAGSQSAGGDVQKGVEPRLKIRDKESN